MKKGSLPGKMIMIAALLSGLLILLLGAGRTTWAAERLRVSFSLSESEWEVFRKQIIPEFEKRENCKIDAAQIEASDLPKLLEAGKMAGQASIDLFAQDNMQLSVLVKKGLVEDLSAMEGKLPATVYPSMVDAGKFDGKLLFIPFRPNVQIFYYNKAKFDQYGVAPPACWDDWLKIAKTFKAKDGIGRVLIKGFGGAPTVTQIYEYIVSAGGDPFTFNDKGCIATFTFFKELWKYASPDSKKAKYDNSNDYLARDSVYLMQNWPFGYSVLTDTYQKKNIEVYHGFPGPAKEAHVVGGDVLGIPVGAKNKELAVKWIHYLLSKEVQIICAKALSWPSVRQDANVASDSPVFKAVNETLKYGVFRKNVPYWTEFQKYFEEAFIRIVINGGPVEETLNQYHDKMETTKNNY